jgi:hypothetical protein
MGQERVIRQLANRANLNANDAANYACCASIAKRKAWPPAFNDDARVCWKRHSRTGFSAMPSSGSG